MASIGHVAIGMACGRLFSPSDKKTSTRASVVFSVVALWPDIDAVAFAFGVPYAHPWGHRGATHSIFFAVVLTLASVFVARWRGLAVGRTAILTALAAASHGLLDTMTFGGGLGCALLWPFSRARFWAPEPLRVIPIAPIGAALLTARGLRVMLIELVGFAPLWIVAFAPRKKAAR